VDELEAPAVDPRVPCRAVGDAGVNVSVIVPAAAAAEDVDVAAHAAADEEGVAAARPAGRMSRARHGRDTRLLRLPFMSARPVRCGEGEDIGGEGRGEGRQE